MKKLLIILGIILFIPICVNAETLTYDVCEVCEYRNLDRVSDNINSYSDLSDKDIIINIINTYFYGSNLDIGSYGNIAKSVTINGNDHDMSTDNFNIWSNDIGINDIINVKRIKLFNPSKITVNNVKSYIISLLYIDEEEKLKDNIVDLTNKFIMDDKSINNTKTLLLAGNININNFNFGNMLLLNYGGKLNIYNSVIKKVSNLPAYDNSVTDIYNSRFNKIDYVNIKSFEDESMGEFVSYVDFDSDVLSHDIYDISGEEFGIPTKSITTVYFDKAKSIKCNEKIDLTSYLDYYTEDKEILYTIEDQSIAKIENKELIGLKAGSAKVQVTTDDGHVIYNINLTVESVNSGTIEKKEPNTKNYAEADFSSEDLNSVIPLTNEEQTLKDSGKNVDVFLEVKDASETVAKEEKKLIEEKLSSNEEIGTYLDVSLFKQVEGEKASKIEKTSGNITVSLNLPDDLINKDNKIKRTYYILRLHDGIVDKLDTNFDGNVLTFETDRFSTYALTYKDEVISTVNNPKTGDNIIKYMGILFGSILLIVFIQISKLRKE